MEVLAGQVNFRGSLPRSENYVLEPVLHSVVLDQCVGTEAPVLKRNRDVEYFFPGRNKINFGTTVFFRLTAETLNKHIPTCF